jgi:hypothetical protein
MAGANFFTVRVIELWNSVPEEMKIARNSAQFKLPYLSQALMSKAMGNEME